MPNLGDLDYLNEEDRATITQTFLSKIAEAELSASALEQQALLIKENIKRWQTFLGLFELVQSDPVATPQNQNNKAQNDEARNDEAQNNEALTNEVTEEANQTYDKSWSQQNKALYAISNPQVIGKHSVAGGLEVLQVLHKLDPEFIPSVEPQPLRRKFTNLVSTLAWEGKLMKLREKQNKGHVHYIPLEWVENGSLKPQYSHLLEELEPIPTKKRPPLQRGPKNRSLLAAVIDANPDTGEAEPPVDKVQKTLPVS